VVQVWERSVHSVEENDYFDHCFFEMSESQNINYVPKDKAKGSNPSFTVWLDQRLSDLISVQIDLDFMYCHGGIHGQQAAFCSDRCHYLLLL
jgi:hypothetical protein